jgi:glycine/D-amino acid oxidase-like deaminating enzyme
MIKIAIIGAGFSGIATAWHLLQLHNSRIQVTVFDSTGLGGGASGMAAGLMYPYAGAHAKLNRQGKEGFTATSHLLTVSSETLGMPVAHFSGVLRIAISDEQKQDFALSSKKNPEVVWQTLAQNQKKIPGLVAEPGIFIESAAIVDCKLYLEGLWKSCEASGATFIKEAITDLKQLDDFDQIIIAAGASCRSFPEFAHINLTPVKGQILEFGWPKHRPPLPCAVNSQAYLVMHPHHSYCLAGATFEKDFDTADPDPAIARAEILPKIQSFFPDIASFAEISCRAGIRASTPTHMPFIGQINKKCWAITGMGSKGLLYHALYAKQLATDIHRKLTTDKN